MSRRVLGLCLRVASSSAVSWGSTARLHSLSRSPLRVLRGNPDYCNRAGTSIRTRGTAAAGDNGDEDEVVYTEDELRVSPTMLRRIVEDLKRNGHGDFVIPWHDEELVEEILKPLKEFVEAGVNPSYVLSACAAEPTLFSLLARRGADASRLMAILVETCALPYEEVLRIMAVYGDELMRVGAESIQRRLDRVNTVRVATPNKLGKLIKTCPALLFAVEEQAMGSVLEALSAFFSRKEISAIVQRSPTVLLQNVEELEQKFEYIYFQMGIEGADFMDCERWPVMPLEEVMARHDFLLKTGRYRTPDKKTPQLRMENPTLHEILDSSEEHFACAVAGVTTEEWILYQALRAKLASGPPSFERIKPSMRKAYERRAKETATRDAHVFDGTREI